MSMSELPNPDTIATELENRPILAVFSFRGATFSSLPGDSTPSSPALPHTKNPRKAPDTFQVRWLYINARSGNQRDFDIHSYSKKNIANKNDIFTVRA